MIINFAPARMDIEKDYSISVEGDTIYINGEAYDFSPMGLGDMLPTEACTPNYFQEGMQLTRGVNGVEVIVRLPFGPNAPYERRFLTQIVVMEDGNVELPPYDETIVAEEVQNGND